MTNIEPTKMASELQSTDAMLKNYVVIRDLSQGEEPSKWTKSQLAVDTRTNDKVLISRLDKMKFEVQYGFIPQSGSDTDEIRVEFKKNAESKYQDELKDFIRRHTRVVGLDHPNIAKVIDVGIDHNGEAVVTTEYVDGAPIFDVTCGMSILGMIPIFLSILEALDFIHDENLLHLNLKSKRVFVKAAYPSVTKLTDYGYAVDIGEVAIKSYGSPIYSAPEVILQESGKISETSDLYSFAALAYSCMCRADPFPDREEVSDIGKLKEIVTKEHEQMKPSQRNTLMLQKDCDKEAAAKIDKLEDIIVALLKANPENRSLKSARVVSKKITELFQDELNKKKLGDTTVTKSMSNR
ncbi:MAG: protein kinase [Pseudomonadota bacterium]